ncbi:hypothetical protein H696_01233 [Fonticula alba]|uniref:Actin interacting protein 3 C-terminal domain-containing protein n=1 Tax=Fonticula alba TaxID=691883 RepID=A0A058ZBL5_FONAL|nr:hypothetical protein H696_01233 [Fonticula alba]KCV71815.1 hypothetical protein H696_01233 [Fonticula alba]|eukprot:XP_009493393.1 hypothetical protein H696_01233 [Fonticula alba]
MNRRQKRRGNRAARSPASAGGNSTGTDPSSPSSPMTPGFSSPDTPMSPMPDSFQRESVVIQHAEPPQLSAAPTQRQGRKGRGANTSTAATEALAASVEKQAASQLAEVVRSGDEGDVSAPTSPAIPPADHITYFVLGSVPQIGTAVSMDEVHKLQAPLDAEDTLDRLAAQALGVPHPHGTLWACTHGTDGLSLLVPLPGTATVAQLAKILALDPSLALLATPADFILIWKSIMKATALSRSVRRLLDSSATEHRTLSTDLHNWLISHKPKSYLGEILESFEYFSTSIATGTGASDAFVLFFKKSIADLSEGRNTSESDSDWPNVVNGFLTHYSSLACNAWVSFVYCLPANFNPEDSCLVSSVLHALQTPDDQIIIPFVEPDSECESAAEEADPEVTPTPAETKSEIVDPESEPEAEPEAEPEPEPEVELEPEPDTESEAEAEAEVEVAPQVPVEEATPVPETDDGVELLPPTSSTETCVLEPVAAVEESFSDAVLVQDPATLVSDLEPTEASEAPKSATKTAPPPASELATAEESPRRGVSEDEDEVPSKPVHVSKEQAAVEDQQPVRSFALAKLFIELGDRRKRVRFEPCGPVAGLAGLHGALLDLFRASFPDAELPATPVVSVREAGEVDFYELDDMDFLAEGCFVRVGAAGPAAGSGAALAERFEQLRDELLGALTGGGVAANVSRPVASSAMATAAVVAAPAAQAAPAAPTIVSAVDGQSVRAVAADLRSLKATQGELSRSARKLQKDIRAEMHHAIAAIKNFKAPSARHIDDDSARILENNQTLADRVKALRLAADVIRLDITRRRITPDAASINRITTESSDLEADLSAHLDFIESCKTTWKRQWETEIKRIGAEKKLLEEWENDMLDLDDERAGVSTVVERVAKAAEIKSSQRASRPLDWVPPSLPDGISDMELRSGLLSSIQSRDLEQESLKRMKALEETQKFRKMTQVEEVNPFQSELSSFVGQGRLRKTSESFEEMEREREARATRLIFEGLASIAEAAAAKRG